MKTEILAIANDILDAKGSVTTLEVKNRARLANAGDPNFRLTQTETSDLMAQISREEGWNFTIDHSNGNTFRVYTRGSAAAVAFTSGNTTAVNTPASPAPSGNIPSPSNGSTIVYLSGRPQIYFQTFTGDRNDARSEANAAFRQAGHTFDWSNLNVCNIGYFVAKYGSQL